jgi:hypothetical protein
VDVVQRPPRPGRSFIPRVGRRGPVDYRRLASLLGAEHPLAPEHQDGPAHPGSLAAPDGRPRVRIRRGGVWY